MLPDKPLDGVMATVLDHGFSESSKKKTPYIWIKFQLDDEKGPNGEDLTIEYRGYLTEKTIPYVLKALSGLRWSGKSLDLLDGPFREQLKDRKAKLVIDMEKGEDEKFRARIQFINDPEYSADKPMNNQDVKKLALKFGGFIEEYRKANPVASAPAKEEEIPF